MVLVLACACVVLAFRLRDSLRRTPGFRWLMGALAARVLAYALTVLESNQHGLVADAMNALEHLGALASTALLLTWVVLHGRKVLLR